MPNWQPNASINHLRQRATIIQKIRKFFLHKQVLEVETPILSRSGVTDIHLFPFTTQFTGSVGHAACPLYHVTSPEYHMKRLLAAGSGSIFQIGRCFRNGEFGRYHNPEFTMLEWYLIDYNMFELMDEVDALLQIILLTTPADRMTYCDLFQQYLSLNPLEIETKKLIAVAQQWGYPEQAEQLVHQQDLPTYRDALLTYLFCFAIEPHLGKKQPLFVYHYPRSQAMLAALNVTNNQLADRFELYYKGVELANGFRELTNAAEQQQRFMADNEQRSAMGLSTMPIDMHFIAALNAGLPDSAGVAIGLDRLIMLALGATELQEILTFSLSNA